MNDQVLMRIRDCRAHFAKQDQTLIDRQSFLIAKPGDGFALDVLHGNEWQAIRGAAVEQSSNVGMIK